MKTSTALELEVTGAWGLRAAAEQQGRSHSGRGWERKRASDHGWNAPEVWPRRKNQNRGAKQQNPEEKALVNSSPFPSFRLVSSKTRAGLSSPSRGDQQHMDGVDPAHCRDAGNAASRMSHEAVVASVWSPVLWSDGEHWWEGRARTPRPVSGERGHRAKKSVRQTVRRGEEKEHAGPDRELSIWVGRRLPLAPQALEDCG